MKISEEIDYCIEKNAIKEPRNYIGASSIGKTCERAIWYEYQATESLPLTAQEERIMETGRRLEGMVVDYFRQSGYPVITAHEDNDNLLVVDECNPCFKGHMDGIIQYDTFTECDKSAVLEVKTANDDRYSKYAKDKEGVKSWSPIYYAQIQSYMGMSELSKCLFVVLNKNNGDWRMEWVDFDPEVYQSLQNKAKRIAESEDPPGRISDVPWYYMCKICRYNKVCHYGDIGQNEGAL